MFLSGDDLEYPFRQQLRKEKGFYFYVKKVDPLCNLSEDTDQDVLLDYVYEHYTRFPSLGAMWLREKIGPISHIQIQGISLHLTPTENFVRNQFSQPYQPIKVALILNGHHIKLLLNWQTEQRVGSCNAPCS